MKHFYLALTLLLTTSIALAQVPSNYYDSANGLTEYALKTQLKEIIDNNSDGLSPEYISTDLGYSALYTTYLTSDVDSYYENNGSVLDMYTENPTGMDIHEFFYNSNPSQQDMGTGGTAEGQFYNREHIIPQSTFSSATPMRSDAHFVVPSDKYINGQRGNIPFGDVATPSPQPYSNGTQKGSSAITGYSGIVFEPIDEFKGDIARMHFYFATRYESTVAGYNYDMFNNTSNQVFTDAFLNVLLTWHSNDPVSTREIDRNNAIFAAQNNRNPYIDHPEYVNAIWNPMADIDAPTTPTSLIASNPTAATVDLSWTASTDNIAVTTYDIYIDGAFYVTTNSAATTYTVTGLSPETTYTFNVLAKDAAGNASAQSTSVSETTITGGSGGAGALYFSEYMEGSSSNKALEIANFTGTDINDLSVYELRLSSNGNSVWTATYSFPSGASITNNDVYVIANGSLAFCTGVVDNSNNTITGFNGNDAIGLFKNGVLIDILGTLGNNSTYAENTTLVRNANITGGNTVFDINEWTASASNTCTDLGQHTQTLSIVEVEINEFKIYPNPIKGNILNIETKENTRFEIYDLLGKKVLEGNVTQNYSQVSVSRLNEGVYILKLQNKNGITTKKLIKE